MNPAARWGAAAVAVLASLGAPRGAGAQALPAAGSKAPAGKPVKPLPPPPLPDTPARLWLIAPGPAERWTLRIDNEGSKAIRIPADIRLLSFEIEVPSNDPKQPKKKPTVYKCEAPAALRSTGFPESRALLLAPGQSYIESFDPRLFCFGKNAAALVGTAVVHTRFGWDPPSKWSIAAKKPPAPPFAAEGTENPATTAPLRQLTAPTFMLSFGTPPPAPAAAPADASKPAADGSPTGTQASTSDKPAAAAADAPATGDKPAAAATSDKPAAPPTGDKPAATSTGDKPAATATGDKPAATATGDKPAAPAPIVDANAPRLAVSTPAFSDASAPRGATITVTVANAGHRPMFAALRPRMIAFEVRGPDHTIVCSASPPTRAIPRDLYREYKPDAKSSFTVLLQEVCPEDAFTRSGLYQVKASFWANESGSELGLDAFTGRATAAAPTLLRVASAREPFYRDPPKAVPTPKPEMPEDDGESP